VTWTTPIDPPADGTAITRAFYITYTKDNLSHLRTVTGGDPSGAGQVLASSGAGVGSWTASPSITALTLSGALTAASGSFSGNVVVAGTVTVDGATLTGTSGFPHINLGSGGIFFADRFAVNTNEYMQASAANEMGIYVGNSPRYKQTAALATFLTPGVYTTSWTAISDRRLKTAVKPVSDALERLLRLKPITYRRSDLHKERFGGGDDRLHGFIAQDVQAVLPDLVEGREADDEFLSVDYARLVVPLVAAVQELAARVDALSGEAA
jgi:hypothetical protein